MRTLTIFVVVLATTFAARFTLADEVVRPVAAPPTAKPQPMELQFIEMAPTKVELHPGRGMKIAGIVLTSVLGGAGLVMIIAGEAANSAKHCSATYNNDLGFCHLGGNLLDAFGGGFLAVGLAVGIPLWVVGAKRELQSVAKLSFAPIASSSSGGGTMMLSGTF